MSGSSKAGVHRAIAPPPGLSIANALPDLPPPDALVVRLPPDVADERFHQQKQIRWFVCGHCFKEAPSKGQSYPHDGAWLESKKGRAVSTLRAAWLAGENFPWYCTACHADCLGYGTGYQAENRARVHLGLHWHRQNRAERMAAWFRDR